jgi:hypothetical protein
MTDQTILGAIESFKGLVYKYNTKDQVDMYNRTTKRLVDYVTVEYGSNMKNLVKYREEKVFTEPEPPTETDKKKSEAAFVRYKEMGNHFMRDMREYEDQKAKVFGVILGQQCTHDVISKLESDTEFATIEQKNDVVGLLDMLKVMSHSTVGVQNPYWAMQDAGSAEKGHSNQSRQIRIRV